MGRHGEHTPGQRTEIVLALLRREEPASVLARRHKVSEQTFYRWRDEFLAGGKASLASGKAAKRQGRLVCASWRRSLAERDRVIDLLVDQVTAAVRWEESVRALRKAGVTSALELGSGSVLRGLMRRIDKELPVTTIGEPHEVRETEIA